MINFRPVFLLASAAALAAFLACSFGWFALLFSAGIAAFCAVCLFVRRKKKKPMLGVAAFCAILVALFCAVAAGFQAVRADYENAPAFEGKCLVTGTVREVSAVERGWRLTLDGVSVFNADGIAAAEQSIAGLTGEKQSALAGLEAQREALEEEIPAGRFGTPREAADLVWQTAHAPAYMTGQVIGIDGGYI